MSVFVVGGYCAVVEWSIDFFDTESSCFTVKIGFKSFCVNFENCIICSNRLFYGCLL